MHALRTRLRVHLGSHRPPSGLLLLTLFALSAAALRAWVIDLPTSPGTDGPAHAYKTALAQAGDTLFWDNYWYSGSYGGAAYGLVYYHLAALVSEAVLVIAAIAVLPGLFYLYARRALASPSLIPAFVLTGLLVVRLGTGQNPFVVGLALVLGGLVLLVHGRPSLAAIPFGVALFIHPLAVIFGMIFLAAGAFSHPKTRGHLIRFFVTLAPFVALRAALLLGLWQEGLEPTRPSRILAVLAVAAVCWLAARTADDPARGRKEWIFLCGGLACAVALVLPGNPVGDSVTRFFEVFAIPVVLTLARPRVAPLALAVGLTAAVLIPLSSVYPGLARHGPRYGDWQAYFSPALEVADELRDPDYRIHVVSTRRHWESFFFPLHDQPLARGWYRQSDALHNTTLSPACTPPEYAAWLRSVGVRYVFVPQVMLDPNCTNEPDLAADSAELELVFNAHRWKIYQLTDPEPLVVSCGPGGNPEQTPASWAPHVVSYTRQTLDLEVERAGDYLVKVTYSPYWALSGGDGELHAGPDRWVLLEARGPGRFRLSMRPSIAAALQEWVGWVLSRSPEDDAQADHSARIAGNARLHGG